MREGGELKKVYLLLTTEERPAGSGKLLPDISSEFTHKCARDKVIWDMINTLFLTTVAVKPTFVALLSHSQT